MKLEFKYYIFITIDILEIGVNELNITRVI